jgi:hypothetical protein
MRYAKLGVARPWEILAQITTVADSQHCDGMVRLVIPFDTPGPDAEASIVSYHELLAEGATSLTASS